MEYGYWFPPQLGGETAEGIDRLIDWVHWFMLLLFVGWGIFFIYCLVKFRARSGHKADYELVKAKPSKWLEVGVVIFEAVLLIGFAMPAWAKYKNEMPSGPDVVEARLVAQQFAWNFHYAGADGKYGRADPRLMNENNPLGLDPSDPDGKDDIWTINELHIPVDTDFILRGSSKDVIHSFSVPVLRVKQDLIPGMSIPIWLHATKTSDSLREANTHEYPLDDTFERYIFTVLAMEDVSGIIKTGDGFNEDIVNRLKAAGVKEVAAAPRNPSEIACAQLCGNSHYKMKGYVVIESRESFDAWLAAQAAEAEDEEDWD